MKTERPDEQINYIATLLRDAEGKGEPLYFTIKIERFGEITPSIQRGKGEFNYMSEVNNCLLKLPDALIVELFSSKSPNNKQPQSMWKIPIRKNVPEITRPSSLGQVETVQSESQVNYSKYMDDQLALKSQQLETNFEKRLLEYDVKVKNERIAKLESEAKETEEYIEQLEDELEKFKSKNSTGAYAEKISDALVKGLLGMTEDKGKQLSGTENGSVKVTVKGETGAETNAPPAQSQEKKQHLAVVELIAHYLKGVPSEVLRKVYQLLTEIEADKTKTLLDGLIGYIASLKKEKT